MILLAKLLLFILVMLILRLLYFYFYKKLDYKLLKSPKVTLTEKIALSVALILNIVSIFIFYSK